ncbi:MAG: APC family permease [Fimbriimonadaceae bacterium]|nr:APC family permease [Fimbriimonadaceae bacterium]
MNATSPPRQPLKLLPLVAAIYFCVSGGPHGLEPLMQSGAGLGVLLILLTPIFWAIPAALMTAELTSALPDEGGFYGWVKRAFGPRAASLCAWWTWMYSWVDVAIYPVLFATYAREWVRMIGGPTEALAHPVAQWLLGLVIIVPFTALNIRGAQRVGQTSIALGVALLAPFAVLIALAVPRFLAEPARTITPFVAPGESVPSALSAGLFVVMWNYLGWDSLSTVAGEVDAPRRNFPRALAWALPIILLTYLLPTLAGLTVIRDPARWEEGLWPEIGRQLGGPAFGLWIAMTGMVSSAGLFASTLLGASRIPYVLAAEGQLPAWLTAVHPRFGTPHRAILGSAVIYAVLSFNTFENLAVVDVMLYSAAILIEFAALVVLRWKEPDLPRPFRIPGGRAGVVVVVLGPVAIVSFGVVSQFLSEGSAVLMWSFVALVIGAVLTELGLRRARPERSDRDATAR